MSSSSEEEEAPGEGAGKKDNGSLVTTVQRETTEKIVDKELNEEPPSSTSTARASISRSFDKAWKSITSYYRSLTKEKMHGTDLYAPIFFVGTFSF